MNSSCFHIRYFRLRENSYPNNQITIGVCDHEIFIRCYPLIVTHAEQRLAAASKLGTEACSLLSPICATRKDNLMTCPYATMIRHHEWVIVYARYYNPTAAVEHSVLLTGLFVAASNSRLQFGPVSQLERGIQKTKWTCFYRITHTGES